MDASDQIVTGSQARGKDLLLSPYVCTMQPKGLTGRGTTWWQGRTSSTEEGQQLLGHRDHQLCSTVPEQLARRLRVVYHHVTRLHVDHLGQRV